MDLNTVFRQDKEALVEFHGRTWRWHRRTQRQASRRRWALSGAVLLLILGLATFDRTALGLTSPLQDSDAYRQGSAAVISHPEIGAQYGAPLSFGVPSGGIQLTASSGTANLQFDVTGPRAAGTAFVEARRRLGRWEIEHLVVENASGARVEIR